MQLHISPSLRHVTVLPGKGVREYIKVKVASRRVSCRMLIYSLLFFTFLLRFVFVLTAVDTIDGESKCSTLGTFILNFSLFLYLRKFCIYSRKISEEYVQKAFQNLNILILNISPEGKQNKRRMAKEKWQKNLHIQ